MKYLKNVVHHVNSLVSFIIKKQIVQSKQIVPEVVFVVMVMFIMKILKNVFMKRCHVIVDLMRSIHVVLVLIIVKIQMKHVSL